MRWNIPTLKDSAGDTIIEVMVALAVLGAVLGGAYVVVSRNVITNQSSQERLMAVKIAESQFERLQIVAAGDDTGTVFLASGFCVTVNNVLAYPPSPDCLFDSGGNPAPPTTATPLFRVVINRDALLTSPATGGTRFKISVTWQNIRGTGDDTLDYFYEVYR